MRIAACIPTRGNVDLAPILEPLPADWEVVVWDNSREVDFAVYGRYKAIERTDADVIYTQDDDCVSNSEVLEALAAAYRPGALAAVMPAEFHPGYPDSALVGFGALFDRGLPFSAFARYEDSVDESILEDLELRCDVIFSALTPLRIVEAEIEILPYAYGPDRMFSSAGHYAKRQMVLDRARAARERICG